MWFPVLWFLSLAFAAEGVMDRVAAVVDDEVIALSEVYDLGAEFVEQTCRPGPMTSVRCVQEAEYEILDVLIKRALIKGELEELRMSVGAAQIDQAIDQIARDNGFEDRAVLRGEIEKSGMGWSVYRQQIREELMVQQFQQRVLVPRVSLTDDEVRDVYDRTARGERIPVVKVDAIGIILPPEAQESAIEQTNKLVESLNAGEVPWKVAKERFDGADVNRLIGDKMYKKGQLAAPLDAVVFDAPVGEFLEPIRVGDVMMVVRVVERKVADADIKPYGEAAPAIRGQLMQKKLQEAEDAWYQRKRRESAIEVMI